MIWPSARKKAEIAIAERKVREAESQLAEVQRRWPAVKDITAALVTRRVENGFGDELQVAWTPVVRAGKLTEKVD